MALSKPLRPLAIFMGIILTGLIGADFFMEMKGQNLKIETSSQLIPDGGASFFFGGLIAGLLLGIGLFFIHVVRQEDKKQAEQEELALLLGEVSRDDTVFNVDEWMAGSENSEFQEDSTHPIDPWERGADWWKSAENG